MSVNSRNYEKKLKEFVDEKVCIDSSNAFQYIDAVLFYKEVCFPVALLEICKKLNILKLVLSTVDFATENYLDEKLVKFMKFLISPNLSTGTSQLSVDQCCRVVYDSRVLESYVLPHIKKVIDTQTLAKFISRLMMCVPEARTAVDIKAIAQILEPLLPRELRTMLFASSSGDTKNHSNIKAPLHDNDFPSDFRRISIVPTANEIEYRCANEVPPGISNDYVCVSMSKFILL